MEAERFARSPDLVSLVGAGIAAERTQRSESGTPRAVATESVPMNGSTGKLKPALASLDVSRYSLGFGFRVSGLGLRF